MDSLLASIRIAESGLHAQSQRLRIISENVANKDVTSMIPGGIPYRRQIIFLRSVFDESLQASKVEISRFSQDMKNDFIKRFQPYHPAADAQGYVLYPNVDSMIEVADSKEAERSYQLNLNLLSSAAGMVNRVLSIISGK